jgi:hypothetical protein
VDARALGLQPEAVAMQRTELGERRKKRMNNWIEGAMIIVTGANGQRGKQRSVAPLLAVS